MPQMSPMYWTLLLVFSLMITYMYLSILFFNLMNPTTLNHSKTSTNNLNKKLTF